MKIILIFFFIVNALTQDCTNFDEEYICKEFETEYPSYLDENGFQTPPRDDELGNYKNSYQDMHYLVGYSQLKYSPDRKICAINIITKVNPKLGEEGSDYEILYYFDEKEQKSNSYTITSDESFPDGMKISVRVVDMEGKQLAKLELEDEYFFWDNPPVNIAQNYENGQKGAIIELFGWPYNDIAEECEFIGKAGYLGIKLSPSNEHILSFETVVNGELNPWWYIYQPVSYKFHSRSGDKKDFKKMINKCRKEGVRIYSDAIINHMTSEGNDSYKEHRKEENKKCNYWGASAGSAGSPFWNIGSLYKNNTYTGKMPVLEYPSVPYFPSDFHCKKIINKPIDGNDLNYQWLLDLADLNTEKEYVQQRVADYITSMLSLGISGFRLDAARYTSPQVLSQIFKKIKDNLGGDELPDDFITYLEVIIGEQKDLVLCGNGDYSYGNPFIRKMKEVGLSDTDIEKIKIWRHDFPGEYPICKENDISSQRSVVCIDTLDDQNDEPYRNMGSEGSVYILDKNIERHKNLNIKLFTRTDYDWKIKMVLSSYSFMNNGGRGYPDGKSDCSACIGEECKKSCTKSVPYQKAYDPDSIGYDTGDEINWKEGTYTRVHRNEEIINAMRKWMGLDELSFDQLYGDEKLKVQKLRSK